MDRFYWGTEQKILWAAQLIGHIFFWQRHSTNPGPKSNVIRYTFYIWISVLTSASRTLCKVETVLCGNIEVEEQQHEPNSRGRCKNTWFICPKPLSVQTQLFPISFWNILNKETWGSKMVYGSLSMHGSNFRRLPQLEPWIFPQLHAELVAAVPSDELYKVPKLRYPERSPR